MKYLNIFWDVTVWWKSLLKYCWNTNVSLALGSTLQMQLYFCSLQASVKYFGTVFDAGPCVQEYSNVLDKWEKNTVKYDLCLLRLQTVYGDHCTSPTQNFCIWQPGKCDLTINYLLCWALHSNAIQIELRVNSSFAGQIIKYVFNGLPW